MSLLCVFLITSAHSFNLKPAFRNKMVSVFEGQLTRTWLYPIERQSGVKRTHVINLYHDTITGDCLPLFCFFGYILLSTFVTSCVLIPPFRIIRDSKCYARLSRNSWVVGKLFIDNGIKRPSNILHRRRPTWIHRNQEVRMDRIFILLCNKYYCCQRK